MIATVPLRRLSAVWIQVTGTWCNLQCTHCINASGPVDPWLAPMAVADVERHVDEAARLGAREVYFTGGEPFLHPQILELLAHALARLPTTVLTNGTLVTERVADRLAELAARSRYSLEIRVSLDDPDREANDRVRGRGAFDRALAAIARLHRRGLPAILTATDLGTSGRDLYGRLRRLLAERGVAKPRIKLLPLFPVGRTASGDTPPDATELEGIDLGGLQCADSRTVTADGIYACPILAGLPQARLTAAGDAVSLSHEACRVCVETGASCRNG
ncbi:MAG TPA: radical SAM protein [Candidatus Acidoferrum sp.]|nr:radical SAM protein [Candidatus Acidoferrum sp.]